MNSQMTRTHGHHYEGDPEHLHQDVGLHAAGGHHEDEQHEKKSVIKKVKAKAKKIKETLGLKKHDHDHDHDLDEEDDFDDELIEDPEVHGAPMYESAAAAGIGNFGKDEKVNSGQPRINLGQSSPFEKDPHAPKDHRPGAFSSPGNYQTKVTDPTGAGGKEANMEPLIHSFGKMDVVNEPEPKQKPFSGTGSHDQFSPDLPSIGTKTIPGSTQPGSQTFDATKFEHHHPEDMDQAPITTKPGHHHPEDMNVDQAPRNQTSSYTQKISSATSAIAGKAVSAKTVVASKLGYGGDHDNVAPSEMKKDGEGEQPMLSTAAVGGYGWKIASTVTEKLAPVYEKVAGAGTAVVSKVQGTVAGTATDVSKDAGTDTSKGPVAGAGAEQDKGITIKDYLAQKLTPGDEDKALSEVISEVLHKKKDEYPENIAKSMNKVTESPEVARQLGTDGHENKDGSEYESGSGSQVAGNNKGMVDRVKGAVSSWFGKGVGDQIRPTESSHSPDSLPPGVDEQDRVSGTAGSVVGHVSAGSGVGHEGAGIVR